MTRSSRGIRRFEERVTRWREIVPVHDETRGSFGGVALCVCVCVLFCRVPTRITNHNHTEKLYKRKGNINLIFDKTKYRAD